MYKLLLKTSAEKDLKKLPKSVQVSIAHALDELTLLGSRARNTKKLKDPIGGYRTRVGSHRILFDINEEIILVHRISKRAEAYR